MTSESSNILADASRKLSSAITDQLTIYVNTSIFQNFGMTVQVLTCTSLIDGEFLLIAPIDKEGFAQQFEMMKRVLKESLNINLVPSELEKANIVVDKIPTETKGYYIQFPRKIDDMEVFQYSMFKEITRQVMIGKTMDGDIKLVDDIERKIVVVYGEKGSGVTNLRNVLESEIKGKNKRVFIRDLVSLAEAWKPSKAGIYFIEKMYDADKAYLEENESANFIFIHLREKGFGEIYDKNAVLKVRIFKFS